MKRQSKYIFIVIAVALLLPTTNIILIRQHIRDMENDAATLNSLGIIRGSIQRFSKLELYGANNEGIRMDIKSRIERHREVPFIDKVAEKWAELESFVLIYREDPSEYNRNRLLKLSEECWKLADQAVFENQILAENKSASLTLPVILMALDLFAGVLLLYIIKKYVYDNLEIYALYDPLTNIYNRRYFYDAINREILNADRKNTSFCLIMFDIDHFKKVNDIYGHSKGDDVLKEVVSIAQSTIRKTDILARLGGEEFSILLPDSTLEQAVALAERVRENTGEHSFGQVGKVTVSLGVALYESGNTLDDIIKKADTAMYKAKSQGRNRVGIYP